MAACGIGKPVASSFTKISILFCEKLYSVNAKKNSSQKDLQPVFILPRESRFKRGEGVFLNCHRIVKVCTGQAFYFLFFFDFV